MFCPGSNPGWGTSFFEIGDSHQFRLLFYNLDVAKTSPPRGNRPASLADAPRGGVAWFPSSNGQDRGPSSRVCRFKSGRERQYSSRCSAARQAHVVRDHEAAGSNPAGETNRFPCSSVDQRARGYDPRGRGFESLPGCQHMAPYLKRKSPRLSSGSTRVQVPPAPPTICRAASSAADPYVSARSSTAREQPALNRQVAGSTPAAPTNTTLG